MPTLDKNRSMKNIEFYQNTRMSQNRSPVTNSQYNFDKTSSQGIKFGLFNDKNSNGKGDATYELMISEDNDSDEDPQLFLNQTYDYNLYEK